jgi:anti-sigma regulatory factor (Ser/Thr protein kinase)
MIDKEKAEYQALRLIEQGGRNLAPRLAATLGVSSQAANLRVQALVKKGWARAEGKTRARRYYLVPLAEHQQFYQMQGLSEDRVWSEFFLPALADLPDNVRSIWQYGITEMVNNAIDHSESNRLLVSYSRNGLNTRAMVVDYGVGIFNKIQKALGLLDPRESLLELAKGKLTTDPEHHSGEGIFFSSKIFDNFNILSGRLFFTHGPTPTEVMIDHGEDSQGTIVSMGLDNTSARTTQEVFHQFAAPDAFTFDRTLVPVKLAMYEGTNLVSRSQAKRLYSRFERFKHVMLDFKDVAEIGQAFADELFRVFPIQHPEVDLTTTNMVPAVEQMVQRALAARNSP